MSIPEQTPVASSTIEVAANRLMSKMWLTLGARFNAGRRLRAMQRWSLLTSSVMSLYVIVASAAPLIIPLGLTPKENGALNLVLIGVAIFILILTLLESMGTYELRAERLHECATEISELRNEFDIRLQIGLLGGEEILDFQRRYDSIVRRYPANHEPVDELLYRTRYPELYQIGAMRKALAYAEYYLRPRLPYLLLILAPAIPLWVLLV